MWMCWNMDLLLVEEMKRVAAAGDRQRVVARSAVAEARLRGSSAVTRWRRWRPRWLARGRTCVRWRARDCGAIRRGLGDGVVRSEASHRADHRRRPAQV